MKLSTIAMIAVLAGSSLTTATFGQHVQTVRAVSAWNLEAKSKLAIKGYDPVAYFSGSPMKGKADISTDYKGAVYQFATSANRDAFLADPAKFEPAYGGWCAWAMKDGEKVEVDPTKFIVKEDRLYLFYDGFWGNTKAKWEKEDHAAQVKQADGKWKTISGEDAPMLKAAEHAAATLKPQLDAMRENFASKAPAETVALYEKGIRDVGSSGVLDTALKVGAKAPEFSLPDAKGERVALSSMLAKGPVVVTWYRGAWCPYCNVQLREYQKAMPEITALGAQLVAISPQTPDSTLSTQQKNELVFAVLSDAGNGVAKQFGIAYTLPAEVAASFKGKLDLAKFNGDASNELPLSATYVIGTDGVIRYAFVDADYRNRAEPAEIVAALKALQSAK
ncbi:MAG TPA: peroxiredoxin-like family protein [Phycisphaerales bacterium]|nr:peroxiredoxin-like family protein [Phycisphaerales bacterium]